MYAGVIRLTGAVLCYCYIASLCGIPIDEIMEENQHDL